MPLSAVIKLLTIIGLNLLSPFNGTRQPPQGCGGYDGLLPMPLIAFQSLFTVRGVAKFISKYNSWMNSKWCDVKATYQVGSA